MIELIRDLYYVGFSQREIAERLNRSQNGISLLMRRHGINTRPSDSGRNNGQDHPNWKGNDIGYGRAHVRLVLERGAPSKCEVCGTTKSKRFEWANMTKNYTNVNDYKRMCATCHKRHDGTDKNIVAHNLTRSKSK